MNIAAAAKRTSSNDGQQLLEISHKYDRLATECSMRYLHYVLQRSTDCIGYVLMYHGSFIPDDQCGFANQQTLGYREATVSGIVRWNRNVEGMVCGMPSFQ
jgi:hypothetical protein